MKSTLPRHPVVVITGASSGNGRAAALEFARAGARLVLASRNLPVLREVARECGRIGVKSAVVRTDVSDSAQVERLAREAIRRFGRIDVWINNAGVGAVGLLNQTPMKMHEQVIATNLIGAIHGCRAVLPHFIERKRGIIINTNSVGAWVPLPFATAYSASKFGLRGFLEALRAELSDFPDIHVCELFPAFVRTPAIHHAANFVGRQVGNPPIAGDPRRVGRLMVRLAESPHDRRLMMLTTRFGRLAYFLFPKLIRWLTYQGMKKYLQHAPRIPQSPGNLKRPALAQFGVTVDKAALKAERERRGRKSPVHARIAPKGGPRRERAAHSPGS